MGLGGINYHYIQFLTLSVLNDICVTFLKKWLFSGCEQKAKNVMLGYNNYITEIYMTIAFWNTPWIFKKLKFLFLKLSLKKDIILYKKFQDRKS